MTSGMRSASEGTPVPPRERIKFEMRADAAKIKLSAIASRHFRVENVPTYFWNLDFICIDPLSSGCPMRLMLRSALRGAQHRKIIDHAEPDGFGVLNSAGSMNRNRLGDLCTHMHGTCGNCGAECGSIRTPCAGYRSEIVRSGYMKCGCICGCSRAYYARRRNQRRRMLKKVLIKSVYHE